MTTAAEPMNAEDIGRRVLKLIEDIRGVQDLSPERIEQATGLGVSLWSQDRSKYGLNGRLAGEWYFGLRSMPPSAPGAAPDSLLFSFSHQDEDADPSSVCALGFQDYKRDLVAAGFTGKPVEGFRGVDSWRFVRGDVSVTAYVFGDGDPSSPGACVSQLIISARMVPGAGHEPLKNAPKSWRECWSNSRRPIQREDAISARSWATRRNSMAAFSMR